MKLEGLNPTVISAGIYERLGKSGKCIAYAHRLLYVFSGGVTAKVGDKETYKLSPGHILYIPAGIKYQLKSPALRMGVITFLDQESKGDEEFSPVSPEEFDEAKLRDCDIEELKCAAYCDDMENERDTVKKICGLFTSEEGEYRAFASAYLKILLLKLFETAAEDALPSRMVEALGEYIKDNLSDGINNTEIGAIFGYHPFYVSRMLKEKKGLTMKQYVIQHRLKLAKRLLQLTKKTVNEIAEETGFTDASYFTKTFREAFGMTPKEYRNRFADNYI